MEPAIQYARTSDGVNIAYYSIGAGEPPLVYLTTGSHLEREWACPEQRQWLQRLAADRRLVRFDRAGRACPIGTTSPVSMSCHGTLKQSCERLG
jgi:hypothetical protein